MDIQNVPLRTRASRAISLQESGLFVVDDRNELPLPSRKTLPDLTYSREYDFQNAWGCFSRDPQDSSLLILRKGTPPNDLYPQPKLSMATATLHSGYVSIHNNGSSFDLDVKNVEGLSWSVLRLVNETLRAENIPVVVWQMDLADDELSPVIRIYNESAMVFGSSVVWSMKDQQLVAAQVVSASQDLLRAIKATLANNNSKSYLTVKTKDDSAYLKGARRGFINVSNHLASANAQGTVTTLLHPLTGDPQANPADYFYVIVTKEEELSQKFVERLDLCIPWPLQAEWSAYLLEAGKKDGLIETLSVHGKDFTAALRVEKNESQWQQVIARGLKNNTISIA